MASAPHRRSRDPRRKHIPDDFLLKWHSSRTKPLVRRPPTACESCRIAKVKCDRQPRCSRCAGRDSICSYANVGAKDVLNQNISPPTDEVALPLTSVSRMPNEIHINSSMADTTHEHPGDTALYDPGFGGLGDWEPDAGQPALNDFSWPSLATEFNSPHFEPSFGQITGLPDPSGTLQIRQLSSLPQCQCRESLVKLVPQVNAAMWDKNLDEVFKGTQKVVEGFLGTVQCTVCSIACTDLICIMAIFQQTGAIFEYIAQAELGNAIKMEFGGLEVPIHDLKLRATLVTTLIHQAYQVLDAIESKGQAMLGTLCPPSTIARNNIEHLETAAGEFRELLRMTADAANDNACGRDQTSRC